jgi:hypothetical protein
MQETREKNIIEEGSGAKKKWTEKQAYNPC